MSSSSDNGRDSPMFVRPKVRKTTGGGEDRAGAASGSASAAPGGAEQRQAAATNEPLEAGSRQVKGGHGESSDEPSPILSPRSSLRARHPTVPTKIDEIHPEITKAPEMPVSSGARLESSGESALDRELQLLSSMTSKGIRGGNASLPVRGRTASLFAGATSFKNKPRPSASMSDLQAFNRSSSIPNHSAYTRSEDIWHRPEDGSPISFGSTSPRGRSTGLQRLGSMGKSSGKGILNKLRSDERLKSLSSASMDGALPRKISSMNDRGVSVPGYARSAARLSSASVSRQDAFGLANFDTPIIDVMRILKMYPAVLIQQSVEEGDETDELDEEGEESPDYKELSGVFERGIETKPATRRGAPTSPTLSARMSTGGVPSLLQEIMESESALDSYREEPRRDRKTPEISNFGREGGSRPIERQYSTRVKASKTGAGKSPCLSAKISTGGVPSMLEDMAESTRMLDGQDPPVSPPGRATSYSPYGIVSRIESGNNSLGNQSLGNQSLGNQSLSRIESQPRTLQRPPKGKKSIDGAPKSPTMSARVSTGGVPSLLADMMESEQAMRGRGFSQEGLEAPGDDSGHNLNKRVSTPVVKPKELIVSRYSFLEAAMRAPSLLLPVSAMTPPPEPLPSIAGTAALDCLWALIELHGGASSMVSVLASDGSVHGIATFNDVYKVLCDGATDATGTGTKKDPSTHGDNSWTDGVKKFLSTDEDSIGYVDDEVIVDVEETTNVPINRTSHWQTLARVWVRSAFTELLVAVFLILDLSMAAWEVTVPIPTVAPGSMAPQDSMSGVILLFYIYEGSIRIFGFRKAIFDGSRIMDTIDISVIFVSVIVYIVATLAQATGGSLKVQQVVTVARVLRLIHLIQLIRRIYKRMQLIDEHRIQSNINNTTIARATSNARIQNRRASQSSSMAYPPPPEQNIPGTPTMSAAKVFESLAKSVTGSLTGRQNRERERDTLDRDYEMGALLTSKGTIARSFVGPGAGPSDHPQDRNVDNPSPILGRSSAKLHTFR